jgi:RNA-directed DNA polymerase
VKRAGGLISAIGERKNLALAVWRAARGKRDQESTRAYIEDLEANFAAFREGLDAGDRTFDFGNFTSFKIRDPKERMIQAPRFSVRVAHHAIMNVCEPEFERALIDDTYACRAGKGTQAAALRGLHFTREFPWFLQMDIRKYFDSVDHEVLLRLLARRFKDRSLLNLFRRIIAAYETRPGKGLPIGSLMSQHFANFYLNPVDRLAKERLRLRGYVRYMDDSVVWAGTKAELEFARDSIRAFLAEELKLELKDVTRIGRSSSGVQFVGFRVRPRGLDLARSTRRRARRRLRAQLRKFEANRMTERDWQIRLETAVALARRTGREDAPRQFFGNLTLWEPAWEREPGSPRRELERHREEPAMRVSQLEPPSERERQPGIPSRSSSD